MKSRSRVFVGNFFIMNLFVGVVIDHFNSPSPLFNPGPPPLVKKSAQTKGEGS